MKESHSNSRSKAALGGKKKSGGKHHTHEMHIKRAKNGGFVVHHLSEGGGPDEPPEIDGPHVMNSLQDVHSGIDQQMGDQPPAQASAPPEQAGPTAGPAPAAQPGM